MKRGLILSIILGIICFISLYFNYTQYSIDKKNEQMVINELNYLTGELSSSLDNFEVSYDTGDISQCKVLNINIISTLYRIDELLYVASLSRIGEFNYAGWPYDFKFISYAFEGKLPQGEYQNGIFEDETISKNEREFIQGLKRDIDTIHQELSKTKQIRTANQLILDFLKNWFLYAKQNTSGKSYYDLLKLSK